MLRPVAFVTSIALGEQRDPTTVVNINVEVGRCYCLKHLFKCKCTGRSAGCLPFPRCTASSARLPCSYQNVNRLIPACSSCSYHWLPEHVGSWVLPPLVEQPSKLVPGAFPDDQLCFIAAPGVPHQQQLCTVAGGTQQFWPYHNV